MSCFFSTNPPDLFLKTIRGTTSWVLHHNGRNSNMYCTVQPSIMLLGLSPNVEWIFVLCLSEELSSPFSTKFLASFPEYLMGFSTTYPTL